MTMYDFGPEAIQVFGYRQSGKTATAGDFYDSTRANYRCYPLSTLCLLVPFAPFMLALGLCKYLLGGAAGYPAQKTLADALFGSLCARGDLRVAITDAVAGAAAHFSAAQIAFVCAALLSLFTAVSAAANVLAIHKPPRVLHGLARDAVVAKLSRQRRIYWGGFLAASLVLCLAVSGLGYWLFNDFLHVAFRGLDIPDNGAAYGCLSAGSSDVLKGLIVSARWGVGLIVLAVAALMIAASAVAWRFDLENINGRWADTYVLRHKLKSLLTLFFLSSVLLVSSNLALASLTNVWTTVWSEAAAALDDDKPAPSASSCYAFCFSAPKPAKAEAAAPSTAALKETVTQAKTLRSELLFASGVLGSLLLVAIFTPALYGLTGEIEMAGKTHARNDPPVEPPTDYEVAGYEQVEAWKKTHGLAVTFPQLTGSLVAILAPVLSGGLLDVAKAFGSG